MKTIKDFNVELINESHLIVLKEGSTFYRRSRGDPLEFRYNDTTFTTSVPLEQRGFYFTYQPTGAAYATTQIHTVFKETENYTEDTRLYELKLSRPIERILDLNLVCKEQEMEREYLRPDKYFESNKQQMQFEKELYNLYGLKLKEKNIFGVIYRSRQDSEGDCIVFYDNLPHVSKIYASFVKMLENLLISVLHCFKNFGELHNKISKLIQGLIFKVNGYTLREYVYCKDITDDIVTLDGKNSELLEKINEPKFFFVRI